jgi:RES domain-containing protein
LRVWRLADRRYATFDGEGARLSGGRWNLRGTPVIYASESLSLAVLEYSVNVDPRFAPDRLVSIQAEFPDDLSTKTLDIEDLPPGWSAHPAPEELALLGTKWADSGATAVLVVPSALVPEERNFVLNPRHPDFRRIVVRATKSFKLDPRILKK